MTLVLIIPNGAPSIPVELHRGEYGIANAAYFMMRTKGCGFAVIEPGTQEEHSAGQKLGQILNFAHELAHKTAYTEAHVVHALRLHIGRGISPSQSMDIVSHLATNGLLSMNATAFDKIKDLDSVKEAWHPEPAEPAETVSTPVRKVRVRE